jgi:hypothetical protein
MGSFHSHLVHTCPGTFAFMAAAVKGGRAIVMAASAAAVRPIDPPLLGAGGRRASLPGAPVGNMCYAGERGARKTADRRAISMRFIVLASFWLILAAPPSWAQVGFDRPGSDYVDFPVRSGDPAFCALRCEREAHCRAWSFSYPAGESAATCWLKSKVPARVEDAGSVSGVRGASVVAPRRGPVEFAIDRVGGDYKSVELSSDPSGLSCKAACEADKRCRAWTYLRPGYVGSSARCFLKDKVKPPRHKPCCVSGVVR